MDEGNCTKETMHDVKKGMEPDSQSAGRVPKEENNTKALNNVFRNGWLKLAGPASKSLVIALSGSAFVALSDNHGSRREAEELTEKLPMPKGKEADGGVAEVPVRKGTTPAEPPARIVIARTPAAGKSIKVLKTYRIVLLGETKAGKSSLANTIFEEDVFKVKHSPTSGKSECQADSKSVDGRRITLIETLDFFGKDRSEEELRREVGSCMTASAPGPHAFFIVLKVERSPDYWKDVIQRIAQYLPEAFNYAAVVFTHGDQLPKGTKIEEFVEQNKCLSDLVKKCRGRCHVVDNKYWTTNQQGDYRSNKLQVAELLNTTDKILMENKGGCYKMQRAVLTEIEKGGKRKAEGDAPQGDPSETNNGVSKGTWIKFTGPAAKSLAGLFRPAVLLETEGKDDEEEDVGEEKKAEEEEEEDVGEENKVEEEEEEDVGEENKVEEEEEDVGEENKVEEEEEDVGEENKVEEEEEEDVGEENKVEEEEEDVGEENKVEEEEEEDIGEENKVEEEEEEDVGEENKVEEEEVEEGEKKTHDEESDKKDETETEKTVEDKKVTELEKGKETEKKAGLGVIATAPAAGAGAAGAGAGALGAVAGALGAVAGALGAVAGALGAVALGAGAGALGAVAGALGAVALGAGAGALGAGAGALGAGAGAAGAGAAGAAGAGAAGAGAAGAAGAGAAEAGAGAGAAGAGAAGAGAGAAGAGAGAAGAGAAGAGAGAGAVGAVAAGAAGAVAAGAAGAVAVAWYY
ncbi:damage suppressor protein-like [Labrus mixtus]|uniref:damage suppressor protein-like n=1 Tax=Labrus mixtus TaxID=508554 RepID=UPI0029C00F1B|nr:damage suppressor protein-like [Labrus mixtus]